MSVWVSGRTYIRQTGGNTRYIRTVADGLRDAGVAVSVDQGPGESAGARTWAAYEGLVFQRSARRAGASIAWYPADTGVLIRRRGLTTLATIHGVGALHDPDLRSSRATQIWLARTRRTASVADRIVTVSNSSAEDIAALAGGSVAEKIEVIPLGVAEEWFEPAPHPVDLPDLPSDFVLYYGNIEPRKNLPLAMQAVEAARESTGRDLAFIVVGSPAWDAAPIIEALGAAEWVHYLGRRSDDEIRALLSRTAAFIFPSRYEGFGLPVIEAQAAGAPVVCSDRGSLKDVAGPAAFRFHDLAADSAGFALETALRADRTVVAARGREWAARFRWGSTIEAHRRLLEDLGAA